MAVCSVEVVPLGTKSPSVSSYVASCLKILDNYPDLEYQLTPMSTVIEGDIERIFEAVLKMHEVPFSFGAKRVVTNLKVDERRDKELTMKGKVDAVQSKLSR